MLLKTLTAYQKSYDLMREIEGRRPLNGAEYIDALKAKTVFDAELAEHMKPIELEIT